MSRLVKQLQKWHDENKFQAIIDKIFEIPKEKRGYDLVNHLGRAYNNNDELDKALEILLTVSGKGQSDALWNFRMGYAYYYKGDEELALPYFEKSHAQGDPEAMTFIKWIKASQELEPEIIGSIAESEQTIKTIAETEEQRALKTEMLNQNRIDFVSNIINIKDSFPFDYWHNTLFKEHGMEQYTAENCKKAETIMSTLVSELIIVGLSVEDSNKLEKFEKAVLALNALNDETNGALIETGERESLCELFDEIGTVCGLVPKCYGDGDGIASEWREW